MKVVLIPGMGCTPIARSNWYSWLAKSCNNDRTDGLKDLHCNLQEFPDPYQCRESVWLPFVESIISSSASDDDGKNSSNSGISISRNRREDTIVIGHSSGAACAMRLMEKYGKDNLEATSSSSPSSSSSSSQSKLAGVILVAAAYTDLNDEDERRSEYFNREWDWEAMKYGSKHTVLFHGSDDHLIPVSEARYIASKLGSGQNSDDEEDADAAATSNEHNFKYIEMDRKSHFFEPWPEILEVVEEMATSPSASAIE
mmetsp:Transcript_20542/g.48757  ORF Transcript_20542/g.48757 Transcript_20542/m.48757 type:complete len:256 (+) Transcript_20542:21-788(+)